MAEPRSARGNWWGAQRVPKFRGHIGAPHAICSNTAQMHCDRERRMMPRVLTRRWPLRILATKTRLLQSSVEEDSSRMRMLLWNRRPRDKRAARREQIHRSLATDPQRGATRILGAAPQPPRVQMAAQHAKGTRTRVSIWLSWYRARAAELHRRGYP